MEIFYPSLSFFLEFSMKLFIILIIIVAQSIPIFSQWEQMSSPKGNISVGSPLLRLSDRLIIRSRNQLFYKTHEETSWKKVEGKEFSIKSLQNSKIQGDTLFASKLLNDYSLSYSTDKGATWTDIKSSFFSGRIDDFYIEGNSIYVLAWTSSESSNYSALFSSKDKGLTWEKVSNVPGLINFEFITKIVDTIFLARSPVGIWDSIYSGIVRSIDKGKTWQSINQGLGSKHITLLKVKGNIIYAGTADGLYASDNYGITWRYAGNGMSAKNVQFLEYDADTLVCMVGNMVYKSIDNGTTWYSLTDNIANILRDPSTFNNGLTFHNGNVYIASSRGLLRSSDDGINWYAEQFDDVSLLCRLYADGYRLYADTYNNGLFYSDDRGKSWSILDSNFSGLVEVTPEFYYLSIGNTSLFARRISTNLLYRTDKDNIKWEQLSTPVTSGYVNSIMEWNNIIFLSHGTGLFSSSNKGQSWEEINIEAQPQKCVVIRDTLYMLAQNGAVYHSTDGMTWNQFLPPFYYSIIDFKKSDRFMAVILNTDKPKVGTYFLSLLSKDKGITWDTLQFEAEDIIFHGSQILALSRGKGVYYSADDGKSWTLRNEGIEYLDSAGLNSFARIEDDLFISGSNNYKAKFSSYLTSVNEEFIPNYFYASSPYPIPAKNSVRVKVYWGSDVTMSTDNIDILNIFGERVSNNQDIRLVPTGDFVGFVEWNCGAASSGTYIMKVRHGTKTSAVKLTVNR